MSASSLRSWAAARPSWDLGPVARGPAPAVVRPRSRRRPADRPAANRRGIIIFHRDGAVPGLFRKTARATRQAAPKVRRTGRGQLSANGAHHDKLRQPPGTDLRTSFHIAHIFFGISTAAGRRQYHRRRLGDVSVLVLMISARGQAILTITPLTTEVGGAGAGGTGLGPKRPDAWPMTHSERHRRGPAFTVPTSMVSTPLVEA
jgi:hypothetical protein